MQFIRRTRAVVFSIQQIAELVALWRDRKRTSAEVRRSALKHVETLEVKARELETMARTFWAVGTGDGRPVWTDPSTAQPAVRTTFF